MKTLDQLVIELRLNGVSLWVEEERLRYRAAKGSLSPELLAEIKKRKGEIIRLLDEATESTFSQLPPIVRVDRDGHLPLSFAQQRFWFLHQFEPESSSNNMPVVVRFEGSLQVSVLKQSLHALVDRHELLRTYFPSVDGQPTQVISPRFDLTLPIIDLRQVPSQQRDAEALRLCTEEAHRPFDLGKGPILRLLLLQVKDDEHLLLWNMHCIICDGASSDVFYRDLTALYRAFLAGEPSPLPKLSVQYVDYAHWQRQWLQGEVLESQLNYWKQKLEGTLPILQLPTDHPRPPIVQTYRGDRNARLLPKSLNDKLNSLSQKLGGTLFMMLSAAFEVLLHRYSQQNDILISFASAGRGQTETEGLIGLFTNTLIQRINFDGNLTFQDLFDRVREASLEAYAHQDLPFEKLIEELRPELNQGRSPLFQVKFVLNPPWTNGQGMASVKLPNLTITSLFGYIYTGKTKYDLTLVMREREQGLAMVLDYNADLFEASTVERMSKHFETLLESIVANPSQKISELPLLTLSEQQQILNEWVVDASIQPSSIHQGFEAQTQKNPDQIAVAFKDEQLTYQALNNRANQLAHYLQMLGIKPGNPVGVCLERSPEAIVAFLAILKVGGVYIPLSPSSSPDRQDLILQETQLSVVLTQELISKTLNNHFINFVCLDSDSARIQAQSEDNLWVETKTDSLAVILYPDDPTALCRGIPLTHSGIAQLASSTNFELNVTDVFLQVAPFSSATALFEIWGCLLKGSKLIVPSLSSFSAALVGQLIEHYQVTTLCLQTRLFHRIVDEHPENLKSVRQLFVAGDWLSPTHVERFRLLLPNSRLFNSYAVAENTGLTCCYAVTDLLPTQTTIPIGKAIANTQTYVLDRYLHPVPVGVAGELYIGGDRLAQGYYNSPALTDSAFIPNPFSQKPDARLYKTGDLVRYLPDGNLEFVSRIDEVVTIQGLRIEKGRIEAALVQHPAICEAYILEQQDVTNVEKLVAYLVLHPAQTATVAELRQFLKYRLSAHMIPAAYVFLEALPLTASGTINRDALPCVDLLAQRSEEFIAPRDALEQQLTTIWEKLLGHHPIGIHDHFFELGGNSLLSVRLVAEIERTFNYYFPLSSFFQVSTIADIAQQMREKSPEKNLSDEIPPELCLEDYRALLSHNAGRIGKHLGKRGLIVEILPKEMRSSQPFIWIGDLGFSKRLELRQPVYSMPATSWTPLHSPQNHTSAIATLLVDELLTVQPSGPYMIGAYCYEALVAIEMAQQLQGAGKEVALLAMIDRPGPSNFYRFCLKLDEYLTIPRFHWMKLSPLSLINKWRYISKRLQFWTEKDLNEPEPQDGYNPVTPEAYNLHIKATRSYLPKEYSGKVALIKSVKSPLSGTKEDLFQTDISLLFPYDGWENLLTGQVKIYKIPCRHLELPLSPHAQTLGNILEKCFLEVEQ